MSDIVRQDDNLTEYGVPKKLNTEAEIVIKKRKNLQALKERRHREGSNRPIKRVAKHKTKFVRAEQLVKKHRLQTRDANRLRVTARSENQKALAKMTKETKDLALTTSSKQLSKSSLRRELLKQKPKLAANAKNVVVVVRIRAMKTGAKLSRKTLNGLGLRQLYSCVILPNSEKTRKQLKIVEPFVTYGNPSHKFLRELIVKRGYAKVEKTRMPLSDNQLVENHLGEYGIVCVEDIIHEIETCGPNIKQALSFLWPFKLSNPPKPFPPQPVSFKSGGDFGDRGAKINDLLESMN